LSNINNLKTIGYIFTGICIFFPVFGWAVLGATGMPCAGQNARDEIEATELLLT
jgi:hypothetical protein